MSQISCVPVWILLMLKSTHQLARMDSKTFNGKTGSISRDFDLNCQGGRGCCWHNAANGYEDDLDWRIGTSVPLNAVNLELGTPPSVPYLVIQADGVDPVEQAMLVSCVLPAQFGNGTLSFEIFKDPDSYVDVCIRNADTGRYLECGQATINSGITFLSFASTNVETELVISASNFVNEGGGIVIINSIRYELPRPATTTAPRVVAPRRGRK